MLLELFLLVSSVEKVFYNLDCLDFSFSLAADCKNVVVFCVCLLFFFCGFHTWFSLSSPDSRFFKFY